MKTQHVFKTYKGVIWWVKADQRGAIITLTKALHYWNNVATPTSALEIMIRLSPSTYLFIMAVGKTQWIMENLIPGVCQNSWGIIWHQILLMGTHKIDTRHGFRNNLNNVRPMRRRIMYKVIQGTWCSTLRRTEVRRLMHWFPLGQYATVFQT